MKKLFFLVLILTPFTWADETQDLAKVLQDAQGCSSGDECAIPTSKSTVGEDQDFEDVNKPTMHSLDVKPGDTRTAINGEEEIVD